MSSSDPQPPSDPMTTDARPAATTAAAASPAATPRPQTLAVVRAAIAPLHAESRVSSPQTSQALAGELLLVHEERGDWLLAAGTDRYRGWVHRGYVERCAVSEASPAGGRVEATVALATAPWEPASTWALTRAVNRDADRLSLGCRVRFGRGPALTLPLGAGVANGAQLVDGRAVARDELPALFPAEPERVASTAVEYFAGTSYQWGGVTPWGADCSGMVQRVFALHGVSLPRDAWQQALIGDDAGRDIAALRAGDLLFFTDRDDGRTTHVGISVGASRMVHLALGRGGYAVDRFDAEADDYAARLAGRLVASRRVIAGSGAG